MEWTDGLSTPLVASGVLGVRVHRKENPTSYHSCGSIPICFSNNAFVARHWPIGAVGLRLTDPPCRMTTTIWVLAIRRGQSRSRSRSHSQSRSQNHSRSCMPQRSRADGVRRRNPKTGESETPVYRWLRIVFTRGGRSIALY